MKVEKADDSGTSVVVGDDSLTGGLFPSGMLQEARRAALLFSPVVFLPHPSFLLGFRWVFLSIAGASCRPGRERPKLKTEGTRQESLRTPWAE